MADGRGASGVRDDRNVCQLCGALEDLSLCGGCHDTWYCCKDHQREDWKLHKRNCKGKQRRTPSKAVEVEKQQVGQQSTATDDNELCTTATVESKGALCDDSAVASAEQSKKLTGEESCAQNQASALSAVKNESEPRTKQKNHKSRKGKKGAVNVDRQTNPGQLPVIAEEGYKERYFLDSEAFPQSSAPGRGSKGMSPQGATGTSKDAYIDILVSRFDATAEYVVKCLKDYGICVMDAFLGSGTGEEILSEVKRLKARGVMQQGQLVQSTATSNVKIRGDVIFWEDGRGPNCENIQYLVSCMDAVVKKCSTLLEGYTINERTKAMIACYPGKATGYVRHVDNPNGDGRCITCIYYLNKDWDVERDGGMLRIYPEGKDIVADIEPKFDRVLFFWSDRRNPHEVLPAMRERFAVTVWYYEAEERARALKHFKGEMPKSQKKQSVSLFLESASKDS